jgi:RNA polymerase sigma factor (sigma-70 family)
MPLQPALVEQSTRETLKRPTEATGLAQTTKTLSEDVRFKEIIGYHARSFQFALYCCRGDRAEAEDALQQSYAYLLGGGLASFRGEAQLKTWWFGIIRQTALGFFRKLKRRAKKLLSQIEDPPPITKTPELVTEEREQNKKLAMLLQSLPEAQRLALQLYYYEEMTLDEIASVLGSPKSTIQSRIKAGEKTLQARLEEEGLV